MKAFGMAVLAASVVASLIPVAVPATGHRSARAYAFPLSGDSKPLASTAALPLLAAAGGANLMPLGIPTVLGNGSNTAAAGFTETFDTNLAQWTSNSYGQWSIVDGAATTTGTTSGKCHYLSRANASFADLDFRVSMQRTVSQASANSIYFRAVTTPEDSTGDIASGYWFAYSNSRQYTIWKATPGSGWSMLKDWTGTVVINPNAVNELRVVASGSTLTFFINGTQVFTTTDTSLTSGQVGFGMFDADGGTLSVLSASLASPVADTAAARVDAPAEASQATMSALPLPADAKNQSP